MEQDSNNSSSQPTSSNNNNSIIQQWRNPTIQLQPQNNNVRPLPSDFVPTKAEQQLLESYEILRTYERTAVRMKEEAARAKLLVRDAEFQLQQQQQQQQQQNLTSSTPENIQKKTSKRQRKPKNTTSIEGYDDDDDDDDDDEDDDDLDDGSEDDDNNEEEEQQTKHERREAKLAALRVEVDEAKKIMTGSTTANADALLREQHLTIASSGPLYDDGPMLKKKQRIDIDDDGTTQQPSSLLTANLTASVTPPHDFSQSLQLSNSRGSTLFPIIGTHTTLVWEPPKDVSDFTSPNDGALVLTLNDFDVELAQNGSGNNTIAIKCSIPSDSKRFSINITGPSHDDYNSVLFHFNPRQYERGGLLIVNDKQSGTWGHAVSIPLSQIPLMFGQTSCTVMIQINGEGYDMFVENNHCARLEHRTEFPMGSTNLTLQFPSTDDSLRPERWTVYKVWWGNRPIMAKGDVSNVPGASSSSSDHPRKIFISNLPRISTAFEVDWRRAQLERDFQPYGGDRGVNIVAPTHKSYAFVEFESKEMTDLALLKLHQKYTMNRARRSRQEALREERAAAGIIGGTTKTGSVWD